MGVKKPKMNIKIVILIVYVSSAFSKSSARPNDFGESSAWLFKQITVYNICGSPASVLCATEVEECISFYGINPFQEQETPPSVSALCAGMPFNECALKMSKCTDLFESKEASGTVDSGYPEGTSEYIDPGLSEYDSSVYPSEAIGFRYTGTGSPVAVGNIANYRVGGFSSDESPGAPNGFRQGDYRPGSFIRGSLVSNGELLESVGSGHGGFVLPNEPGNFAGLGYNGYVSSLEPGPAGLESASSSSPADSSAFGVAQVGLVSFGDPSEPVGIRIVDFNNGDDNDGFGPFIEVSDSSDSEGEKGEFSGPGIGGFDSVAERNDFITSNHGNFSSFGELNETSGFRYNGSIDSGLSHFGPFRKFNESSGLEYNRSALSKESAVDASVYKEESYLNNSDHSSGSAGGLVEYPAEDYDYISFHDGSKAEGLEFNDYDSPGEQSEFSDTEGDSLKPFSEDSGFTVSGFNIYRPNGEALETSGAGGLYQNANVRPDNFGPSKHPSEVKVSGQLNFESTGDLSVHSFSGHSSIGSISEPSISRDSDYDHLNPSGEIGTTGDADFGIFASPRDPIDSSVVVRNGFKPVEVPTEVRDTDNETPSFVRPNESTHLVDELEESSDKLSVQSGFLPPEELVESTYSKQENFGSSNATSEHDGETNINSKPTEDHREPAKTGEQRPISVAQSPVVDDIISSEDHREPTKAGEQRPISVAQSPVVADIISSEDHREPTKAGEQRPISVTQSPAVEDTVSSVDTANPGDSINLGDLLLEIQNIPGRLKALNLSGETVNDKLSILHACALKNITKCHERLEKCFQLSDSEVDLKNNVKDLSECLQFMEEFAKTRTEMSPSPPDCKGDRCATCHILLEPTADFISTAQACSGVLAGTYTMKKCMKSTMLHHLRTVTTAAIQPKILNAFRECYQEYSFEQIHPCLVNACSKIT